MPAVPSTQTFSSRNKEAKDLADQNAKKIQEKDTLTREIAVLLLAREEAVKKSGFDPATYAKLEKEHIDRVLALEGRARTAQNEAQGAEKRRDGANTQADGLERAVSGLNAKKAALETEITGHEKCVTESRVSADKAIGAHGHEIAEKGAQAQAAGRDLARIREDSAKIAEETQAASSRASDNERVSSAKRKEAEAMFEQASSELERTRKFVKDHTDEHAEMERQGIDARKRTKRIFADLTALEAEEAKRRNDHADAMGKLAQEEKTISARVEGLRIEASEVERKRDAAQAETDRIAEDGRRHAYLLSTQAKTTEGRLSDARSESDDLDEKISQKRTEAAKAVTDVAQAKRELRNAQTDLDYVCSKRDKASQDALAETAAHEKKICQMRTELDLATRELERVQAESKRVEADSTSRLAEVVRQEEALSTRETDIGIYEERLRKKYPNETFIL